MRGFLTAFLAAAALAFSAAALPAAPAAMPAQQDATPIPRSTPVGYYDFGYGYRPACPYGYHFACRHGPYGYRHCACWPNF